MTLKLHIESNQLPPPDHGARMAVCPHPDTCLRDHYLACEPCYADRGALRPTRTQIGGVFLCSDCRKRERVA